MLTKALGAVKGSVAAGGHNSPLAIANSRHIQRLDSRLSNQTHPFQLRLFDNLKRGGKKRDRLEAVHSEAAAWRLLTASNSLMISNWRGVAWKCRELGRKWRAIKGIFWLTDCHGGRGGCRGRRPGGWMTEWHHAKSKSTCGQTVPQRPPFTLCHFVPCPRGGRAEAAVRPLTTSRTSFKDAMVKARTLYQASLEIVSKSGERINYATEKEQCSLNINE